MRAKLREEFFKVTFERVVVPLQLHNRIAKLNRPTQPSCNPFKRKSHGSNFSIRAQPVFRPHLL
jgi:hypothetical protein